MTTATATQTRLETTLSESTPPTVLAIVVTHDGRNWFRDCLVGLNTQTYPLLDVLVVDDFSPDGKMEPRLHRIAKRHLKRRRWGYLRTPRPLGFGGAINWALSRVRTKADLLLFIHDDAALEPQSVEWMVARVLADDNTAIVGPKIVSWDDPSRLEEVGMAADRFGYPYKGLEEGEIDLGQHDVATEVFYVTSTCMLVRHDIFRQLRGWDARMRAFSEDLDLCWRARLSGHTVRMEPMAKARHAIALATGQRRSRFKPTRYYIRRNRLRTVAKNASSLRLLALIPQFLLLSLAEMLGFIILRQPREILNLARALGWNFLYIPQTLTERSRVQRKRRVPDRKLRRLTVRETTRLRFYMGNQAQRLEDAWGRRTEFFSQRGLALKVLGRRMRGWLGAAAFIAVIGLLVGFRNILWASPISLGEMLPYPESATAMWRAFVSPWQPTGLGHAGPAPPAFAWLGILPIATLGAAGAAQKILVLGLGGIGFAGAYKLVEDLVDRPGRLAAAFVYSFGAVGYAGVREGALGALVFGAVAPFALLIMLRLLGWVRPAGWDRGRAVARLAVAAAVSGAFVPGSLLLYAVVAGCLAIARSVLDRGSKALRGLFSSFVGIIGGWLLLLPWSATLLHDGGPLQQLWGDHTWRVFASGWSEHGMASVLLGQTPEAPALYGLALPLLGVTALLIGEGQRRRVAIALWGVVALVGVIVSATVAGWIRPVVASPIEIGVLSMAAFAGLVGVSVGAFRMDLPRRGLGWMHASTIAAFAAAAFLLLAGMGPAFWRGQWEPGRGTGVVDDNIVQQLQSQLAAEAAQEGQFRVLWVGRQWLPPSPSAAFPAADVLVTGARGQVMTDLFQRTSEQASNELHRAIASVVEGTTDRGGQLLGAFNVHYVILERGGDERRWLRQRDLAIVRSEPDFLLLENQAQLRRAGLYNEFPVYVRALLTNDPTLAGATGEVERVAATPERAHTYVADGAVGPGVVFLAEAADEGWKATIDDANLKQIDGGWGNAFDVPKDLGGRLLVSYPHTIGDLGWLLGMLLAWIAIVGAAVSKRRAPSRKRVPAA